MSGLVVHVHGDGPVVVTLASGTEQAATHHVVTAEAVALVAGARADGETVAVRADVGQAPADAVLDALACAGHPVVSEGPPPPLAELIRGITPVMMAAANGLVELLADYVSRGVDVTAVDDQGATALHFAAVIGDEAAVRILLDAGADPDVVDGGGKTALGRAFGAGHTGAAALLEPHTTTVSGTDSVLSGPAGSPRIPLEIGPDDVVVEAHPDGRTVVSVPTGADVSDRDGAVTAACDVARRGGTVHVLGDAADPEVAVTIAEVEATGVRVERWGTTFPLSELPPTTVLVVDPPLPDRVAVVLAFLAVVCVVALAVAAAVTV